MLAAGCSVTDIKTQLGHEDIQSTMVYLQMDLSRRRKIQEKFTEYTQAVLSRNAAIEALIAQEEKDDIMTWLDSLWNRQQSVGWVKSGKLKGHYLC